MGNDYCVGIQCRGCSKTYYRGNSNDWNVSGKLIRRRGYCESCCGGTSRSCSGSNTVDMKCKNCDYTYNIITWSEWRKPGDYYYEAGYCESCYESRKYKSKPKPKPKTYIAKCYECKETVLYRGHDYIRYNEIVSENRKCRECSTATLYIFPKGSGIDEFGHASLELGDGTYISWWPVGGKINKWKAIGNNIKGVARSYAYDIRNETNSPHEHEIDLDNQKEIKSWWNRVKKNGVYCATGRNCAKVVQTALQKGKKKFREHKGKWWYPSEVWQLLK